MDAAKRLDDDCSRSRLLGAAFAECPAGEKDTKARTRVGLEQEHH